MQKQLNYVNHIYYASNTNQHASTKERQRNILIYSFCIIILSKTSLSVSLMRSISIP